MRPTTETPDADRVAAVGAIPLRVPSHHEVYVAAEIGLAGSAHVFVAEKLVPTAGPPTELLSAVHEQVELDLIASVQRDGAMSVTVTVQIRGGSVESADVGEKSLTTVVSAGSSAEFTLGVADGLAAGTEAHGTIRNRRTSGNGRPTKSSG